MRIVILATTTVRYGLFPLVALSMMLGCTSKSSEDSNSTSSAPVVANVEFPDGDSSIPAEEGGPGFSGEGWTTADPGVIGDPRAVKGGVISSSIRDWPENLRAYGTGSNTWLNYTVRDLCYESLCEIHPITLEVIPSLATHWQIADDDMTFRFRINPRAHWSDGKPVVAQDWVATYRLLNDDTLIEPMTKQTICEKMEEPRVLSKYMIEVKCKERDWRNFLAIAGLNPLPAHVIEGMTGAQYLEEYNFKYPPVTGAYYVQPSDVKKNESLTLTRREDYWAINEPSKQGLFNFDRIRFTVIRDSNLQFAKACKGEIDFHPVYTAQWWVENVTPLKEYQNGQLIRTEIFTRFPKGIQGLAFNMRQAPLDDLRVRKALFHLYDRKTMLTKFAFDQYERLNSYYPGSDWANPDNPVIEYDPTAAINLLEEAGWSERDTDGTLIKDGQRLSITIMYSTSGLEKYFTSYQESCRKVGVEVKLSLVTPEALFKSVLERTYQVASMAWGAILYPNPRSSWSSAMADKEGSNNITGFKSPEVDALIQEYDAEFDQEKRNEILRQLDKLIYDQVPYALAWYNPCERIMYWNKFGMPDYGLPRYGEYESAFIYWWYDADKAERLKQTRKSGDEMGPIPDLQIRPWDDAGIRQARQN